MWHRRQILGLGLMALSSTPSSLWAQNAPSSVNMAKALPPPLSFIPGIERLSQARFRFWGMLIFEAELWTPPGGYKSDQPFCLKLSYARAIKGRDIAQASYQEMKHQGLKNEAQLKHWQEGLTRLLPDIERGDHLIGYRNPKGFTELYQSGRLLGEIDDPEFTRAFFNIWLGPKTSQPKLRAQLLRL